MEMIMKAYCVRDVNDYEEVTPVVFAETAKKAIKLAWYITDEFCEVRYIDLRARRFPEADQFYTEGKKELDWNNPEERAFLIAHGWHEL